MFSTSIKIEPYPYSIVCIVASTMEDCSKIAKQSYQCDISYDGNERGSTQLRNNKIIICLLTESIKQSDSIIVHESFHATAQLLRSIGADICPQTEEVIAYLQEYIYGQIKNFTFRIDDKS